MFEVYHFSEKEVIMFGLVLLRISSCLVILPIFGSKSVPSYAKILLSLAVAFVLFPVLKVSGGLPDTWKDDLILLAAKEAFVGVSIGYLARLIFMSIEMSGQVLGFSFGFNAAELINPNSGQGSSIIEQFQTVLATLLFLSINGHYLFFEAIFKSFEIAPIAHLGFNPNAMSSMTVFVQQVFLIGIKLAAPMMAVILFINIAMAVVGRAVPQINVFVVSFPINILVGLFVFMVSIPLIFTVMETDFINMGEQMFKYLKGF